jgi:DNA-binding transcriptional LysR family regulator
MDHPVELRQLRYFVAVAEELHFGRAAERLHMSQSPLSRAIRELERDLGVVLFVRTTRRVELTPAGTALLERARGVLSEMEQAIGDARQAAADAPEEVVAVGYGPFTHDLAGRIASASGLSTRLEEGLSAELLQRVGGNGLAAAAVFSTPGAARHHGVRIDTLRDEPLLAALPTGHPYAPASAIPLGAFAAEVVLLPREPAGHAFNTWLRAVVRAAGYELERTLETLSAPWDHRMLPVAAGDAVSVFVGEWAGAPGLVALPLDPPLSVPLDLASRAAGTPAADALVRSAIKLRDAEGWLTERPPRTELPD